MEMETESSPRTLKVVDCDTHFWQPVELWQELIDKRYRETVVEVFRDAERRRGEKKLVTHMSTDAAGRAYRDVGDRASDRLRHMDEEEVDVQIIFPGASRAPMISDADVAAAACRAVNRWNAEFASLAPNRLKPAMVVPMRFPNVALEEISYATKELGLRSVFVAPTPPPERRWSDSALDPVWELLEASKVVVCFHEFSQLVDAYPSVSRSVYEDSYQMMYYCGHTVESQLALMDLVVGGVMERHPSLYFGFIEAMWHGSLAGSLRWTASEVGWRVTRGVIRAGGP
jgi:predicted TIM-barrel fold metal-dependent hydrolase